FVFVSFFFFFSSRRRHTRFSRDWSSDVCSSDLGSGLIFDSFKAFTASLSNKENNALMAEWQMVFESDSPIRAEIVKGVLEEKGRSEERRVGKECRGRRGPCHERKER